MKSNESSINTARLKSHFLALFVPFLVLASFAGRPTVAVGKSFFPSKAELHLCVLNLMGVPKESTEARARYARIAKEARTQPARQPETYDYILKNLAKLVGTVKTKSTSATNPRVKKAISNFLGVASIYERERPRQMQNYLRLAYLGSQALDLLTGDLDQMFKTHDYYFLKQRDRPEHSDPHRISLIESNEIELVQWIMRVDKESVLIGLNPAFNSYVSEASPGWVYIPSFANFGFRTLLWSLSRGIGFVGQVSESTEVDGGTYGPSEFMSHDYAHLGSLAFHAYDPSARKVWDFFEQRLDQSGLTGLELKLAEGLLFMIFHEDLTHQMTCKSIKASEVGIRNRLDDRAEDGYYKKRFNDEKDFGQVFPGGVTTEQIKKSAALVGQWIVQVCR